MRAIQCCTDCGKLEYGHTGPADHYTCVKCLRLEEEAENARMEIESERTARAADQGGADELEVQLDGEAVPDGPFETE